MNSMERPIQLGNLARITESETHRRPAHLRKKQATATRKVSNKALEALKTNNPSDPHIRRKLGRNKYHSSQSFGELPMLPSSKNDSSPIHSSSLPVSLLFSVPMNVATILDDELCQKFHEKLKDIPVVGNLESEIKNYVKVLAKPPAHTRASSMKYKKIDEIEIIEHLARKTLTSIKTRINIFYHVLEENAKTPWSLSLFTETAKLYKKLRKEYLGFNEVASLLNNFLLHFQDDNKTLNLVKFILGGEETIASVQEISTLLESRNYYDVSNSILHKINHEIDHLEEMELIEFIKKKKYEFNYEFSKRTSIHSILISFRRGNGCCFQKISISNGADTPVDLSQRINDTIDSSEKQRAEDEIFYTKFLKEIYSRGLTKRKIEDSQISEQVNELLSYRTEDKKDTNGKTYRKIPCLRLLWLCSNSAWSIPHMKAVKVYNKLNLSGDLDSWPSFKTKRNQENPAQTCEITVNGDSFSVKQIKGFQTFKVFSKPTNLDVVPDQKLICNLEIEGNFTKVKGNKYKVQIGINNILFAPEITKDEKLEVLNTLNIDKQEEKEGGADWFSLISPRNFIT